MSAPWGRRHAPELASPVWDDDVWVLTHHGEDVPGSDVYGAGFAQSVVDMLNESEGPTDEAIAGHEPGGKRAVESPRSTDHVGAPCAPGCGGCVKVGKTRLEPDGTVGAWRPIFRHRDERPDSLAAVAGEVARRFGVTPPAL